MLAIASFLSKGGPRIELLDKSDPVIMDARPIAGKVTSSINEVNLRSLRQAISANLTGWDDDENPGEED